MTQRTLTIEHPETHEPSAQQISDALVAALAEDGLVRDGDYKVSGSVVTSGGPSTVTVNVPTAEKPKRKYTKKTDKVEPKDDKPAEQTPTRDGEPEPRGIEITGAPVPGNK